MTQITPKKNQYALRSLFELAKHRGRGPTKLQVYDETTIQDLPDNDRHLQDKRRQSPTRASQTKQGHCL
jgi:hypothetical protein